MSEPVIIVGHTELDGYGNMWVTPQGGGEKIKIAKKREGLFPLFQQGAAVMLDWQTYMNKPYVADAKPVEGALPPPTEPGMLPEHKKPVEAVVNPKTTPRPDSSPSRNGSFNERSRSIERQVAAKIAFENAMESDDINKILERAETIYNWIAKL